MGDRVPVQEDATRGYTVGSVVRAMRLLEVVAEGRAEGLTLSETARELGVSRSTAYGIARTLVDLGYLRDVEPGPRYLPGMALVRMGDIARQRMPLGAVCRPILVELSRLTGLTTRAAVNERNFPVFVERVDGPGSVRFHTPLGIPELPHTSSAGKAILATLPEEEVRAVLAETGLPRRTRKTITTVDELLADLAAIRRRGFAVDDEEDVDGVFCIGAAFFDHSGQCAGALSATGIKLDLPTRRIEELGEAVRDAAASVGRRLDGVSR